jgi:hypothetical protein
MVPGLRIWAFARGRSQPCFRICTIAPPRFSSHATVLSKTIKLPMTSPHGIYAQYAYVALRQKLDSADSGVAAERQRPGIREIPWGFLGDSRGIAPERSNRVPSGRVRSGRVRRLPGDTAALRRRRSEPRRANVDRSAGGPTTGPPGIPRRRRESQQPLRETDRSRPHARSTAGSPNSICGRPIFAAARSTRTLLRSSVGDGDTHNHQCSNPESVKLKRVNIPLIVVNTPCFIKTQLS